MTESWVDQELPIFLWDKGDSVIDDGIWHILSRTDQTPVDDDLLSFGRYYGVCGEILLALDGPATAYFPIGEICPVCQRRYEAAKNGGLTGAARGANVVPTTERGVAQLG